MHDIRLIRENPEAFDAGLARRGLAPLAKALIALDEERRALTTQVQIAQSRRNEASKLIGAAMNLEAKTIDCRFQRLNAKLGAPDRRTAVRIARLYGLL